MFERDACVSFANCGLPYHIGGVIPDRASLLLQTPESLAQSLALDVRIHQEVMRIDREAKEVEVRDHQQGRTYQESSSKLVLCPGAAPIRSPIPGVDNPRGHVLRNVPGMDRSIAQFDQGASRAVVSGDIHLWYPEDYPECATRVTILDTRTPAKYSVMRFECGGHHEQAAGK